MMQVLNADLTELLDIPELVADDYEIQRGMVFIHVHPKDDNQTCSKCNSKKVKVEEILPKRIIRDREVFGKQCYIVIHPRRYRCLKCRNRFTEKFNFLNTRKSYTNRYAEWIHKLCLRTDLKSVSELEGMGYKKVESIFFSLSKNNIKSKKELKFSKIGLDEISLKKGHKDFIAIVSDLTNGRPLAVLEERTKKCLDAYFEGMSKETKGRIKEASIDMWGPFSDVIRKHLPNAKIVVDRFHVQGHLNDALSKVRRKIQKDLSDEQKDRIKGCRWILLKNMKGLTKEEKEKLKEIYNSCEILKKYHKAKEDFRNIFEKVNSRQYAKRKINKWIDMTHRQNLYHYSKFVNTVENWKEEILNYFISKTTNGFVEGLNNRIKVIKRMGFGFTNIEHFSLRILQI